MSISSLVRARAKAQYGGTKLYTNGLIIITELAKRVYTFLVFFLCVGTIIANPCQQMPRDNNSS